MARRAQLVRCPLCGIECLFEALSDHVWSVHLSERSVTPRKAGDVIRRALAKIKILRQDG